MHFHFKSRRARSYDESVKILGVLLPALLLAACEPSAQKAAETKAAEEKAAIAARPTPVPTPKPGDWRMKDYKNPLEKKPKK